MFGKEYDTAKWLHNIYEGIAKKHKWDTQKITKVSFDDLPIENKNTMLGVSVEILKKFVNKDKLKDSINSALNFVKEHNKQTPFGAAMFDKQDYILPVNGMSKDEQTGFVNGLNAVLRILKE